MPFALLRGIEVRKGPFAILLSLILNLLAYFNHCKFYDVINDIQCSISELGQSLSDFGKAVKLLGACEGDSLGKAFAELGTKSEALSIKLQAEAGFSPL